MTTTINLSPQQIEKIAEAGRRSFFFFCTRILGQAHGFEDIQEVPHRWMCDVAQKWNKSKKILLTPRDTFKTTVLVVAYALWRIINDYQITILLTSDTENNSRKSLSAIKSVMENHEFFRICYGDLVSKSPWSNKEIAVNKNTRHDRAPTITISGADSSAVGSHYKLILFDDPHNQNNIRTPELIQKVIDYYRGLMPLMDSKEGQLCITATRWAHHDIHDHIMTTEPELFDIYIKAAYEEIDGKIVYFFPNRVNDELLTQRKIELGSYFFNCQYMNDITDEENALFKTAYFKNCEIKYDKENGDELYYKENNSDKEYSVVKLNALKFFVSVDPAGRGNLTDQRRLDYSGFVVVGVDEAKRWFIVEAFRQRGLTPADIIDILIEKQVTYTPETIGIETATWQGQIEEGLMRKCKERNIWPNITELHTHNRDKANRIKGLQPIYKAGDVYHNKGLYDLEVELLKYSPKMASSIHDDIIDALAYVKDIAFAPEKTETVKRQMPELHTSPGLMIAATEAFRKGGGRSEFGEFYEDWDPDEEKEEEYIRSSFME
jgi:hypothetical protein